MLLLSFRFFFKVWAEKSIDCPPLFTIQVKCGDHLGFFGGWQGLRRLRMILIKTLRYACHVPVPVTRVASSQSSRIMPIHHGSQFNRITNAMTAWIDHELTPNRPGIDPESIPNWPKSNAKWPRIDSGSILDWALARIHLESVPNRSQIHPESNGIDPKLNPNKPWISPGSSS